jgi:cob(I)alamin adenosyltransferase
LSLVEELEREMMPIKCMLTWITPTDSLAQILESDIDILEQEIDYANEQLPALKSFVLPGGCRASADLHICRRVPVFAKL